MTVARRSQQGNVLGQMLVGILLIAAFILAVYWQTGRDGDAAEPEAPAAEEEQPDDMPVTDDVIVPDEADLPDAAEEAEDTGPLTDAEGDVFSYLPVGELLPESGPGFVDDVVYRPAILFPLEDRAFLNSQVYRYGGYQGGLNGMEGGQCEPANYDYPWQDTFCEKRSREQVLCPGGGHEGLDIRPATCTKNVHWAIAVEDARVIDVRRHWVTLQTADGTLYNYLHLDMDALRVALGDEVRRGDRIGVVSNDFFQSDGTSVPTTIHLHFEMYENYAGDEGEEPLFTKVNPYMTLVAAFDRKLRGE
jgi:murein DD-endopeptidase MepM/ murein hydrolase activator NlpD